MQRRPVNFRTLAVASFLLVATSAHAQRAVCAPVAPDEQVQTACMPFSLFPSVRFLADFTVDQLFKPAPPPFQRTLLEVSSLFVGKTIADNPELKRFLGALAPIRFTQFDRTTGSVLADFEDNKREFQSRLEGLEGSPQLTVLVPRQLQGGYWRGPDVLQIAFWDNGRIAIRVTGTSGPDFVGDVRCLSLTPDGLLVRFAGSTTPPLLAMFRECPK